MLEKRHHFVQRFARLQCLLQINPLLPIGRSGQNLQSLVRCKAKDLSTPDPSLTVFDRIPLLFVGNGDEKAHAGEKASSSVVDFQKPASQ
jgi:hypothetical protein